MKSYFNFIFQIYNSYTKIIKIKNIKEKLKMKCRKSIPVENSAIIETVRLIF